ncbi:MAG: T9SS type A sorting domain-containing protein [Ferruginibacter sp.]
MKDIYFSFLRLVMTPFEKASIFRTMEHPQRSMQNQLVLQPLSSSKQFSYIITKKQHQMQTFTKTTNKQCTGFNYFSRSVITLLVLILSLFTVNVRAQISVTVSGTAVTTPALGASYTSLANALTAVNAISAYPTPGTIVLTLGAGGTETAPPTGLVIGSATLNPLLSSTNTITIVKASGTVTLNAGVGTATPGSSAPDGIISIRGADYITIDGLTLTDGNAANPASMEFGIGLFKTSVTDGANNNTIQNCTINMQRVNNAAATAPLLDGSVGIEVINATAVAATTGLTPTSAAGTNSNNKFYANTINGGNIGIGLNGYAASSPFTLGDNNNDIGGSSVSTGNIILNFGGAASAANPAAGIRANNQWGINISYNDINNNNGSGVNHVTTLRGIYAQAGTSANATINNNTITLKAAGTTTASTGIENAIGSTAAANTVNINNNIIQNCTYTSATTATFSGILTSATATNVNTNFNQIINNAIGTAGVGSGATFQGIYNSGSSTNFTANSNTISGNTIQNSFGTMHCLRGSTSTVICNSNTITNNSFPNSSGATACILYGIYDVSAPVNETYQNNNINNLTITGNNTATTNAIYGISNVTAAGTKVFSGNNVNNLSFSSSSTGYALVVGIRNAYGATSDISKNTIHTLSSTGTTPTVAGIFIGVTTATTINVFNNVIGNLSTPASTGHNLYGIYCGTVGTSYNIYYNTVYLSGTSTGTGFASSAVYMSSTTPTTTLINNILVNLTTPTGTGLASVIRRTSTAFTGWAASSNNNLLYAGTPSASNVIYYNGTAAYGTNTSAFGPAGTAGTFQNHVAARESLSRTETISSTPGVFFQSLTGPATGSSSTFLHLVSGITTFAESGGTPISGYTDDYDGNTRNATTPDMGADEFAGTQVPVVTINSVSINPTGNLCVAAGRTVTANITIGGSAASSITLNYSFNGGASVPVTMTGGTNTPGVTSNWTATIPVGSPVNASVAWNVTAIDPLITRVTAGTSYADEPLLGASIAISGTPNPVCEGSPVTLTATTAVAGATVNIGTGSTTSATYSGPFYSLYNNKHWQMLIKKSELDAAGLSAGNITSLTYYTTAIDGTDLNLDFSVKLANSNAADMTAFVTTGFTQVYSIATFSPVVGANTINFTTPFNWNGTSGIVVEICFGNNTNTNTLSSTAKVDPTTFVSVREEHTTTTGGTGGSVICSNTGTASNTYSVRPQISFSGFGNVPLANYQWKIGATNVGTGNPFTPSPLSATTYTVVGTDANGCSVTSPGYTVNTQAGPPPPNGNNSTQCGTGVPGAFVTSGGGGAGFKWYSAQLGGTLLQASGGTYTGSISSTTHFWVSESNGTCESLRTEVIATVAPADPVQASVNNNAPCLNTSIQLSAANTAAVPVNNYTYSWNASPLSGSGLSGPTAGNPLSIVPTATGTYTYTVTATDATAGCVTTSTVTITVKSLPVIYSTTAVPNTICAGSSTTLNGITALINAGTGTIGAGASTTTDYNGPFYSNWSNKHMQIMIKSTELSAAGFQAGNMTGMTFYTTTIDGTDFNQNFSIKMAQTANTDMAAFVTTGLTEVYTVSTFSPIVGANNITFSTPFNWNGTSNIVFDICFGNSGSSATISSTAVTDATSFVSVIKTYTGSATASTTACPNTTTNSSTYSARPKISINGQVGTTGPGTLNWSWQPGALSGSSVTASPAVTTVYTVTGTDPVTTCSNTGTVTVTVNPLPPAPSGNNSEHCGNAIPTASVSSNSLEPNPVFKWYNAASGGTSQQTGTSTTYLGSIAATTSFWVAEVSSFGCEGPRAQVTITVSNADPITVNASSLTICPDQSTDISSVYTPDFNTYSVFELTASGGAASGVTGTVSLTANGTGTNPYTVTPTASGTYTYTITATDPDKGCITTGSVVVTARTRPVISTVTATPATICTGQSSQLEAKANIGDPLNVKLGTGTSGFSGAGNPYWRQNNADGSKFQFLYKAADLINIGLTAGPINAIVFNVTTSPVTAASFYNQYTISMGHTNATALTTVWQPNMQLCMNPIDHVPVTGDNTYNFDFPFVWDGVSNIVIQVCYNNDPTGTCTTCTGSNLSVEYTASVGYAASAYYYELITVANRDMCGAVDAATTQTGLPNCRFIRSFVNNTSLYTWQWNPGALSGPIVTASPTTTTVYTVTATDANGCTNSMPVTVNVLDLPNAPVAHNSTQCGYAVPTASVTTGGANGTYKWYSAQTGGTLLQTGGSTYTSPIAVTTSLWVSESNATCESLRTEVIVTVNQPDAVTASVDHNIICFGAGIQLSVAQIGSSNTYTYSWSASPASGSGIATTLNGTPVSVTPTAAGTYTYTVTAFDPNTGNPGQGTCTVISTVVVTVGAIPVITSATATPSTICAGSTVTLNGQSVPTGPGSATIGAGASSISSYNAPYYSLYSNKHMQILLKASELTAATLPHSTTITSISFPTTAGTIAHTDYSIKMANTTATDLNNFVTTGFVQVYSALTQAQTANTNNTIILTTPFAWDGVSNIVIEVCSGNATATTTISSSSPGDATSYVSVREEHITTAPGTAGAVICSTVGNATNSYAVRPKIILGHSGDNITSTFNWVWNPGNLSGSSQTVNPMTSVTYTVTATNPSTGCTSAPGIVPVTVNPVPVTPTGTNSVQCGFGVPTASVSGAGGTYKWYSAPTGGTLLQSSTSNTYNTGISTTTDFYVAESNGNCESDRVHITVTVTTADAVSASVDDNLVCPNETIHLSAANTASSPINTYTYSWTATPAAGSGIPSGSVPGSPAAVTPTLTGTYTYTVLAQDNTLGCATTATVTVTVNAVPVISSITANPTSICAGANSTLSTVITNAGPGSATVGTDNAGTKINTTAVPYRTGATTGNQYKSQYLVLASELTSAGFYTGNFTSLAFTVNSGGGGSMSNLTFKIGNTSATSTNTTYLTPTFTTVLTLASYAPVVGVNSHTFTTPFFWDGTSNIVVEVCGTLATAGSGCTMATYTTGVNTTIGNTGSTTGCADATGTAISLARPVMTFGGQVGTNQTASYNWLWNPGAATGSSITVTPSATTTYTATATSPATGCSSSATVTVTVNVVPPVPTATNSTQCGLHVPTASVTSTGGTVKWYSAPTGGTLLQSSTATTYQTAINATTTFYVSESNGNCESGRVAVTVTVTTPDAVVASVDDNTACPNQTIHLSAVNNASSPVNTYAYTWTATPAAGSGIPTSTTGSPVAITPTVQGAYTYTVTAEDASLGCVTTATVTATVNPFPVITSVSATPQTICAGSSASLNATSIVYDPVGIKRGTGTSGFTGAGNPYWRSNSADGSRFQFLYKASDLLGLGLTAGPIDAITLKVTTSPVTASSYFDGFTISMGHTTASALTATWQTGLQQVKNPIANHIPVTGDNTYNFDNSFVWDGVSNIVIGFCYNNDLTGTCTTCTGSTLAVEYTASAYTGASAYYYEVITTAGRDMCGATNAATLQTGLPNVTFIRNYRNNTSFYNWSWSPGNIPGVNPTVSPTTTTAYTATATIPATGCSVNAAPVTVTVNHVGASLSGGAAYCAGQPTTTNLSIALTGAGPWSGTLSPGAIPFSGSSSPITVSVTPSSTTTYTIATLNGSVCTATPADLTGSATVTINPVPATPTITPAGPVTQCGGTVTLTASSPGAWQWNLEGSPIGGANNQTLVVSASGNYSVTVTNEFGCSATSAVTSVTINPLPATPTISAGGPITFCEGGSVTLTSSSATNNQWNLNGAPIGGATNSTLVVTASGDYTVTVTNGFGCTATSAITTVTVNPLAANPTASVVQPTCALGTGTINVTAPLGAGNTYSIGGPFQSSPSFPGVSPGTYTVYVQNSAGCFSPATTNVTVNPQPFVPGAPVVTGIVNVCPFIGVNGAAGQLTYTATATGFGTQTFNWVVPPTLVTIVSGQGTPNLVLSFQNGFATQPNKQIRLTVTNQCGTSTMTIYYLAAQIPNTPAPIVGPTDACPLLGGPAVAYTITKAPGAKEYFWSVPAGASFTHPNGLGVNDTTILVSFTAGYATGPITVQSSNDCGVSGIRSLTVTRIAPSQPNIISGPTNACPYITPNAPATYTVPAVPGVTYQWSASNGAVLSSAQGSNTMTVSYPIGYTGGTISVTATTGCGTSAARNLTITTLNPATPSVPDIIQTHFCGEVGGRKFTYTLSSMPANATSVVWTVPAGATFINLTPISIEVTYPDAAVNGVVTVQATNPCANSVIRSVNVKLSACPTAFAGTNAGTNGTAESKGEVKAAKATTVAPVLAETMEVKIFPNPTVSDFKLQVLTSGTEEITVRVLDNMGRLYKNFKVMPYQTIALGAELKPGSYLVEVRQGKTVKTTKVIRF